MQVTVARRLKRTFLKSLNGAITEGHFPGESNGLGERTRAALAAVAHDHPEASPVSIVNAFDAFALEHGQVDPPLSDDQRQLPGLHDHLGIPAGGHVRARTQLGDPFKRLKPRPTKPGYPP